MKQRPIITKITFQLFLLSLLWLGLTTIEAQAKVIRPYQSFVTETAAAQIEAGCDHTIGSNVTEADGRKNYAQVSPGDIVCIGGGLRGGLRLKNFVGTPDKPIIFKNSDKQVVISSTSYYGILIQNSQHFRLTGSGSTAEYGIKISRSQTHGIRLGWRSENFEIDHIEITGLPSIGISAQTQAVCSDGSTNDYDYDGDGKTKGDKNDVVNRSNFTQRNSILHHNYVHNIGTEAFYLGSSFFQNPKREQCASGYETLSSPELHGVQIYKNTIEETGWDALQVGSATQDCIIHHNKIYRDSQAKKSSQMGGINNNPGSVCDIYNNFLQESGGPGIYVKGYGGNQVYNNIVVNPGRLVADSGIIIAGSSQNGNLSIFNNTIINPTKAGIMYRNEQGINNSIQNNIVVNPGDGLKLGVNISGDVKNVKVSNNIVTMKLSDVKFVNPTENNYSLKADSPAIDRGTTQDITSDFADVARPQGAGFDIGASEYGATSAAEEPVDDGQNGNEVFSLDLEAIQVEAFPGETVEVKLALNNANNLYGLQVTCQVDPTILAVQAAQFGDFFSEPLLGANSVDTAIGTWTGALSQKNPAPALVGDGNFALLTFTAVAAGETSVTCEPLASDRDGLTLDILTSNAVVTVADTSGTAGIIEGNITYQGRFTHANIELAVSGGVEAVAQTDENGLFQLKDLPNANYTIKADAQLYLPNCTSAMAHNNQVTSLMPTILFGGDTDDDDEIRINDATLMGSNFGLTLSTTPAMNPQADINGDGEVNIQDLSLLGGNFGKSGCQDWETASDLINSTDTISAS